jgi:hypothetical protein
MADMLQIEKSEECMSLNTQCEMVIEPASPYIFLRLNVFVSKSEISLPKQR